MATDRPVQLGQKVQFLIDKISKKHWEIRNSEDFEAKLNFVEYIDISIDKLVHIDKKVYESPEKNVNNDSQNNISKLYSAEKERLEL